MPTSLSKIYDACLLDLDGVVYIGAHAAEHARESLVAARHEGMRLAFVTNNASRPPSAVATHLRELGIDSRDDEVVTSAQAAARLLADRLPAGARVLVVGGAGLVDALGERGLVPVFTLDDAPVAVVQGFHPEVTWQMLAEGAYAVGGGLPWVATNVDTTIPTARGIAPGNGTLVQVIATATGREPEVAGKPEPPMHAETVARTGAQRPLVVGDRLDTDIEGANKVGVDSLLVLTGVTTPLTLTAAQPDHRPTLVGPDLRALAASPDHLGIDTKRARYGRWTARVVDGHLEVDGTASVAHANADGVNGGHDGDGEHGHSGGDGQLLPWSPATQDRIDGLRAVCAALWAEADRRRPDGEADDDGPDVTGVADALRATGW